MWESVYVFVCESERVSVSECCILFVLTSVYVSAVYYVSCPQCMLVLYTMLLDLSVC